MTTPGPKRWSTRHMITEQNAIMGQATGQGLLRCAQHCQISGHADRTNRGSVSAGLPVIVYTGSIERQGRNSQLRTQQHSIGPGSQGLTQETRSS
jgi:hypothetical protein